MQKKELKREIEINEFLISSDSDLETEESSEGSLSITADTNIKNYYKDPNVSTKETPFWLMLKSENCLQESELSYESSYDLLDLLHTVILILSVIILIMIFNLFFGKYFFGDGS